MMIRMHVSPFPSCSCEMDNIEIRVCCRCRYNQAHLIPLLVQMGAPIEDAERHAGLTPLALALERRHYWAARVLLDCGADLLNDERLSSCPAVVAARAGPLVFVEAALDACDACFQRGARLREQDPASDAGLRLIKQSKRTRALMLHAGLQDRRSSVVEMMLQRYKSAVANTPNQFGYTPLFSALISGSESDAIRLLSLGAQAHALTPDTRRYPM